MLDRPTPHWSFPAPSTRVPRGGRDRVWPRTTPGAGGTALPYERMAARAERYVAAKWFAWQLEVNGLDLAHRRPAATPKRRLLTGAKRTCRGNAPRLTRNSAPGRQRHDVRS